MLYACRYPEQAVQDVFARGHDVLLGNASAAIGATIRETDGGFVLSGRWRFLSGADHIDWVLLPMTSTPDDPSSGYMMLVPRSDFVIDDTWHVVGLQATGSKDIVLTDAFVPLHRSLSFPRFWGAQPPGAGISCMFMTHRDIRGYVGSGVMGPLIGMAEGALLAYIGMTRKRVSAMTNKSVADSEVVQARLGEAAAEIRAARTLMEQQYQVLRDAGESDRPLADDVLIAINRDRSIAVRLCLDAVDRLTRHMGAIGISESNPVHAFHQDLRGAAGQIAVNFDRNMAPYGKLVLGLPARPSI